MAYTPELSMRSSCTLRRLSWALGVPMTQGIEFLFEYLPQILDREKVCQGCRDRTKCAEHFLPATRPKTLTMQPQNPA